MSSDRWAKLDPADAESFARISLESAALGSCLAAARSAQYLAEWCRSALHRSHLVAVAAWLTRSLHATQADLRSLGLPVDVLVAFPHWQDGRRDGFRPASLGLCPAPGGAMAPIRAMRLQLSPLGSAIPFALMLIQGFAQRMMSDTRLFVVMEPTADLAAFGQLTVDLLGARAERVVPVRMSTATLFAQDNGRAMRDGDGAPVLAVPRAFSAGHSREADAIDPAVADVFGQPVTATRTHWEGGNVISDTTRIFVGADTLAVNRALLGLTEEEVLTLLEADFGAPVTVLGAAGVAPAVDPATGIVTVSGQAAYHLDLDFALLGAVPGRTRPVFLIADPAEGLELLPQVLQVDRLFDFHFVAPHRARALIAAEYELAARARHPVLVHDCELLETLGYDVVGLPDLRVDLHHNVFATTNLNFGYCNVLPALDGGRPTVFHLPWGIDPIDRTALVRIAELGVRVVAVADDPRVAGALMQMWGGLHCFSGSLR